MTPPLLGEAEHVHSIVVFLCVLVWRWIWAACGTILAPAMVVIVKSIADQVQSLQPMSRLIVAMTRVPTSHTRGTKARRPI